MEIKLLTHTPEILISDCAKVCYANNTDTNLVKTLTHNHKHLAVLRFAFAVIEAKGISVPCQNQVVRSKHLDFLVQSKRYVDLDKGNFEFIMPIDIKNSSVLEDEVFNHWNNSLRLYKHLRENGIKKEDARSILPMNTSTDMNIAGNLQSWIDAINLRVDMKAQYEIRTMFHKIWGLLKEVYPNVFTDEYIVNGKTYLEWNSHLNEQRHS